MKRLVLLMILIVLLCGCSDSQAQVAVAFENAETLPTESITEISLLDAMIS